MRGTEGGARWTLTLAPALLFVAIAVQAGMPALAGSLEPIPDNEMTAEAFDDTIAFTPADDADAAIPPLEVHEVDASQATAAGAAKVVDGRDWLDADVYDRNDILNDVEDNMPFGTTLVIDVSTGDIWQVPLAEGDLLPDAFRTWSDEEYYWLDEYWDPPRLTWSQLTRKKFAALVAVAGSGELPLLLYLHTFGAAGYREIQSRDGFQVALTLTWLRETPIQRYLRIMMLRNYYSRLPQFQGNQLAFALMVPDGALFIISQLQTRALLAESGIRPWTLYEMALLPHVLTILDRQIRGERTIVDRLKEP